MAERWQDDIDGENGVEKDIWWVVLAVIIGMALLSKF